MAKKRPQYVTELVNKVNEHLRAHKVKGEYTDNLFTFMCHYLLKRGMYEGYGFFKTEYNTYLKTDVVVFASYKEDDYFLQIY